jgi:hypothetical protein
MDEIITTRDALKQVAEGARELAANGEAVDAYTTLTLAVESYLRGASGEQVLADSFLW